MLLNRFKLKLIEIRIFFKVQSFGSKKRGYLESFPGVFKIGNFIDFDVLFPNFNFVTSYFCRSRRHIGKMAPKSSFLTISPFRLISR
jgi:hypothetical protein